MIESLEQRVLFSAEVYGSTLRVVGTAGDDVITFARGDGTLTVDVNGERKEFDARRLRFLTVDALGGDDVVLLGRMTLRTQVSGGAGDDTLSGGHGGDILDGGAGRDLVEGLLGDDWINPGLAQELGSDFPPDGDADTVSGGRGIDSVLAPESVDEAGAFEATDAEPGAAPVFLNPGQTLVSVARREDGTTDARVFSTFPSTGFRMELLDAYRRGSEITLVVEARQWRGGAGQAITTQRADVNLGALPDGPYRVRVVDRWGGAVAAKRFAAPLAPVQVLAPDRVTLATHVSEGVWHMMIDAMLPDPGYDAQFGNVNRRGNQFFVEITATDRPAGSSLSNGDRVSSGRRLGELAPGKYVFHLTSNGQDVKVLHFRVP